MRRQVTCLRPHLSHVNRDQNVWADQLTQSDFSGFSNEYRLDEDINKKDFWLALPKLMLLYEASSK